jgi:hypothetical protein
LIVTLNDYRHLQNNPAFAAGADRSVRYWPKRAKFGSGKLVTKLHEASVYSTSVTLAGVLPIIASRQNYFLLPLSDK